MTNSPHIVKEFDHALRELKNAVLSIAAKSRYNLERANQALLERNRSLANSVIADDDDVDDLERSIDKLGMGILMRFQPIATDLRFVISSMKISVNLERIGDHAVNIAKRAKKTMDAKELEDVTLIEPVYTLADKLLRDAVTSYSDRDGQLGASLHGRDQELDQLYKQATKSFSKRIENDSDQAKQYLQLIFIVRSLERVGDLASNIGEDSVYLQHATDIRHKSTDEREIPES